MSDDTTINALRDFLKESIDAHYETSGAPLLLATLGQKLIGSGHRLPDGVTLKEFIKTHLDEEISIEMHPTNSTVVAVATAATRDAVRAALTVGEEDFLATVPRAALLAFCKKLDEGQRIFLQRVRPHRYHIGSEAPNSSFVEVEAGFRVPDVYVPSNISNLREPERSKLKERIVTWLKHHNLSFGAATGHATRNALERLLSAQPMEVRRQMLIPGDIAELLLKTR